MVRLFGSGNVVDRRPLAERFPGHMQTIGKSKRGGFSESTLQVRHNLVLYVRRYISVEFMVLIALERLLDIRDSESTRLAEDRRTLS
jgi:hypothetical protein